MNVRIISDFGENSFSMSNENVIEVIRHAMDYHTRYSRLDKKSKELLELYNDHDNNSGCEANTGSGTGLTDANEENIQKDFNHSGVENTAAIAAKKKSRNDSLFGSGWRNVVQSRTIEDEQRDYGKFMEGYKGFLYIKCPVCGEVKGFCAKQETKEHICKCGSKIVLKDLKPMYAKCECGKQYKYYTNMDEELFEYTCLNCGAPVDIKINSKNTAYVTLGKNGGGVLLMLINIMEV